MKGLTMHKEEYELVYDARRALLEKMKSQNLSLLF